MGRSCRWGSTPSIEVRGDPLLSNGIRLSCSRRVSEAFFQFWVEMDHKALEGLLTSRVLNRRITRWALFLQEFQITIVLYRVIVLLCSFLCKLLYHLGRPLCGWEQAPMVQIELDLSHLMHSHPCRFPSCHAYTVINF